jgi:hypothetical protein
MLNLEPLAAESAASMVSGDPKDAENMITKSLMVLTEQGIFAFGLFLVTRKRDQDIRVAKDIHRAIIKLLFRTKLTTDDNSPLIPEYYSQLTKTRGGETEEIALQRLLLTKQLVEMALIYGRYHAKAQG